MLVLSTIFNVVDAMITIAAALTVQSPWVRNEGGEDVMNAKMKFESLHGDPFTLLNIFDEWIKVKAENKVSIHCLFFSSN